MLKYTYQDETRKDNVIPTMKEDGHTIVIPAFTINGHKVPETEMDIDPANDNRARVYVSLYTGEVTLNKGGHGWLLFMSNRLKKSYYAFNYKTMGCDYTPADQSDSEWFICSLPPEGLKF